MGKFDKNSNCKYCGEEMISKNRNKIFCSDKCRVYFKRENVKLDAAKTTTYLSQISTKIVTDVPKKEITKAEMWRLIKEGKM